MSRKRPGGEDDRPEDAANRRCRDRRRRARRGPREGSSRSRGSVLEAAAEAVAARLRAGGKVLVFGNGGSAAEAQHFAAELVNGLSRRDRPALPAIALTTDTSSLTAIGNDRGFAEVFSRQIEALGRPGDVALALTTSGTSPNIVEGAQGGPGRGARHRRPDGEKGGAAAPLADFLLDVPSCVDAPHPGSAPLPASLPGRKVGGTGLAWMITSPRRRGR